MNHLTIKKIKSKPSDDSKIITKEKKILKKQERTHSPDFFDIYHFSKTKESMDTNFNPRYFMKHENFSPYSPSVRDYICILCEIICSNQNNDYITTQSKDCKFPPIKFSKDYQNLNCKDYKSPCDKFGDSIKWSTEHFDNLERNIFSKKMLLHRIQYLLKDCYCSWANEEHCH